jgi:hypothetical protein
LRAKKVEKLRNSHKTASKQMTAYRNSKMIYRNRIQEPGTTISGLADSKKKKKKIIPDRPTQDFFNMKQ